MYVYTYLRTRTEYVRAPKGAHTYSLTERKRSYFVLRTLAQLVGAYQLLAASSTLLRNVVALLDSKNGTLRS